jgi:hypothetical protein
MRPGATLEVIVMNRREFIISSSAAGLASLTRAQITAEARAAVGSSYQAEHRMLGLLPFPQQLTLTSGSLAIGSPQFRFLQEKTATLQIAMESLLKYAGDQPGSLIVNLGSLQEG